MYLGYVVWPHLNIDRVLRGITISTDNGYLLLTILALGGEKHRRLHLGAELVRRGKLARLLGIPEPTVKYYTEVGLFEPSSKTPHGHLLYEPAEMQRRYFRIKEMKKKRLTIEEILERFLIEKV